MTKPGRVVYQAPDEAVARFERAQRRMREALVAEQTTAGQKLDLDRSWQALARTRPLALRQEEPPSPPTDPGPDGADAEGNTGAFAQAARELRALQALQTLGLASSAQPPPVECAGTVESVSRARRKGTGAKPRR